MYFQTKAFELPQMGKVWSLAVINCEGLINWSVAIPQMGKDWSLAVINCIKVINWSVAIPQMGKDKEFVQCDLLFASPKKGKEWLDWTLAMSLTMSRANCPIFSGTGIHCPLSHKSVHSMQNLVHVLYITTCLLIRNNIKNYKCQRSTSANFVAS